MGNWTRTDTNTSGKRRRWMNVSRLLAVVKWSGVEWSGRVEGRVRRPRIELKELKGVQCPSQQHIVRPQLYACLQEKRDNQVNRTACQRVSASPACLVEIKCLPACHLQFKWIPQDGPGDRVRACLCALVNRSLAFDRAAPLACLPACMSICLACMLATKKYRSVVRKATCHHCLHRVEIALKSWIIGFHGFSIVHWEEDHRTRFVCPVSSCCLPSANT